MANYRKSTATKVSIKVGAAIAAIVALVVGGAPKWGILALAGIAALALFMVAVDLRWHRAPHAIGTPVKTTFIFVFVCAAMAVLVYFVWPRVTIKPSKANFTGQVENENYTFTVTNNADDEVYSVQAMFAVDSADAFSFDIPAGSRKPIIDGSQVADIKAISCENRKHNPILLVWIYRLARKESRELSFTHKQSGAATMSADVTYYTGVPQPRINDPLKSTETYNAPGEPITCDRGMLFWLDPSKPPAKIEATIKVGHDNR